MTRSKVWTFAFLVISMLTGTGLACAAESYDNCTGVITSVPAVINTQGTWCVKQDLASSQTSGSVINITTNNVTLDCNDFKISGLSAGAGTTAYGLSSFGHSNITVRHCNFRGFYYGLILNGANGGHVVEDNRFDGNTVSAIFVQGDGSVVRRNRVFNTGNSTQYANASGIATQFSVDILDNTISGVTAISGGNGYARGINGGVNLSGRIIGNSVRGVVKDGVGVAYALDNSSSDYIIIRDNDLVGDGSTGSEGAFCSNTHGSLKDNTISGFVFPFINCTDNGGNDVVP